MQLKKIALAVCGIALDDLTTAEKQIAEALEQDGLIAKQEQEDETTYVLVDGACEPMILVNIHGGLVQDVYGNMPVDVVIVDWDQDTTTDDDLANDSCVFKTSEGKFGRASTENVHPLKNMNDFPEMVLALQVAEGKHDEPIKATYVSEWENGTTVRTPCMFDVRRRRCFDIEQSDTDVGNSNLLEEYVETPDDSFHETDGVTFDY